MQNWKRWKPRLVMTRSLFDEITLDIINEGLENIIMVVKDNAKTHGITISSDEVRKLIEVSNKVALENPDEEN